MSGVGSSRVNLPDRHSHLQSVQSMPFGVFVMSPSDWLSIPQEEELRNKNDGIATQEDDGKDKKRKLERAFSRLSPN